MNNQNKTIRFLTRTAMGVAMVIVAQLLGKLFPAGAVIAGPFSVNQLITGSLVNCVLFVFTAVGGPLLASVIGIGPAVLAVVPLVACGNAILCLAFALVNGLVKGSKIPGVAAAAAVKCAFLWLTVPMLLRAIGAPEKQQMMLGIMFSWPQLCTALIGGALALLILPRLKSFKETN